jgi:hypothetical protein
MRFTDYAVIQTVRSGYAAKHIPSLKRHHDTSRTLGKIVLTPEGSKLKSDMCKWGEYAEE